MYGIKILQKGLKNNHKLSSKLCQAFYWNLENIYTSIYLKILPPLPDYFNKKVYNFPPHPLILHAKSITENKKL